MVQYPFQSTRAFQNEVLNFLGGDEQRYRTTAGSLQNWTIRLDLLDEAELNNLELFFVSASGYFGTFAFKDPGSGTIYPNCCLEADEAGLQFDEGLRGKTTVVVLEIRTS